MDSDCYSSSRFRRATRRKRCSKPCYNCSIHRRPASRASSAVGRGAGTEQVANELGWTKQRIHQYANLAQIDERSWQIVGATVRDSSPVPESEEAPNAGAMAPFTERLLRLLVPLSAEARAPSWLPTYAAMAKSEREAAGAAARLPKVEGEPTHVASLRDLIANAASQQCELCRFLARGKNNKGNPFGKAPARRSSRSPTSSDGRNSGFISMRT